MKDPISLINEDDKFFKQFNVIIASNMQEKNLIKLNKICTNENIILVSLKTNGLFGILRSYVPEHTSNINIEYRVNIDISFIYTQKFFHII